MVNLPRALSEPDTFGSDRNPVIPHTRKLGIHLWKGVFPVGPPGRFCRRQSFRHFFGQHPEGEPGQSTEQGQAETV